MTIRMLAALAAAVFICTATLAPADPLDSGAMAKLEQRLRSGALGDVHAVIVLQGGRTAAEWYFKGEDERRGQALGVVEFNSDTLHDLRSVTKSVVGLLVGLAIQDGRIKSLDQPVLDFFPEYSDLRTPERLKIRLRDVLSMTSGLDWDERAYPYTDPRNSEVEMDAAPDRLRYILSRPVVATPGTRFNYSGGDIALVAAVLARTFGEPIDRYAERRLFTPLGISRFEWLKDRAGVPFAASGARLRPRDMAKIGQMMLQNGRWRGVQVVPAEWAAAATSEHAEVQPNQRCGTEYGYAWWLTAICAGPARTPLVFAAGNGGQYIWIAPSLNLVLVTTAGMYNDPAADNTADEILLQVLAAAKPPVTKALPGQAPP